MYQLENLVIRARGRLFTKKQRKKEPEEDDDTQMGESYSAPLLSKLQEKNSSMCGIFVPA